MLIDIHVRTDRSADGYPSLDAIAARAREAGLDAVCVAEVGVPADLDEVRRVERESGLPIFVGVELPTERGRILAYPPSFDDADYAAAKWGDAGPEGRWGFADLVAWLVDNDWVVVAALPADRDEAGGMEGIYAMKGLHGVVVAAEPDDPLTHDLAVEAAVAQGLAGLGGSGGPQSTDAIGRWATMIPGTIHTQGELARALANGDAWTVELSSRPAAPAPPQDRGRRDDRSEGRGRPRGDRDGRRRGEGDGRRRR